MYIFYNSYPEVIEQMQPSTGEDEGRVQMCYVY
jgi:hypothetical protein